MNTLEQWIGARVQVCEYGTERWIEMHGQVVNVDNDAGTLHVWMPQDAVVAVVAVLPENARRVPSDAVARCTAIHEAMESAIRPAHGSLESIYRAITDVCGVDRVDIVETEGQPHFAARVEGGNAVEVWNAINGARQFGIAFDLIHNGRHVLATPGPHGVVLGYDGGCVEDEQIIEPSPVSVAPPPCPECRGRGSVELFMSVSPCSRGCRP